MARAIAFRPSRARYLASGGGKRGLERKAPLLKASPPPPDLVVDPHISFSPASFALRKAPFPYSSKARRIRPTPPRARAPVPGPPISFACAKKPERERRCRRASFLRPPAQPPKPPVCQGPGQSATTWSAGPPKATARPRLTRPGECLAIRGGRVLGSDAPSLLLLLLSPPCPGTPPFSPAREGRAPEKGRPGRSLSIRTERAALCRRSWRESDGFLPICARQEGGLDCPFLSLLLTPAPRLLIPKPHPTPRRHPSHWTPEAPFRRTRALCPTARGRSRARSPVDFFGRRRRRRLTRSPPGPVRRRDDVPLCARAPPKKTKRPPTMPSARKIARAAAAAVVMGMALAARGAAAFG